MSTTYQTAGEFPASEALKIYSSLELVILCNTKNPKSHKTYIHNVTAKKQDQRT